MTTEKLKQANDLQAKIDELKKHKEEVEATAFRISQNFAVDREIADGWLYISRTAFTSRTLSDDFLAINKKDLITIYLQRVDNEITRLEAEFAALGAE